jgi:KaiC/GvpD/RAD55 family RecA-like ATPase
MLAFAQTLRELIKTTVATSRFVTLFIGSSGSGKSVICEQLTYDYLQEGQDTLYMATERTPSQIVERMRGFGWDVTKFVGAELKFLDLHSWKVDGNEQFERTETGFRACAQDSMDILLAARSMMKEHMGSNHLNVVLDSLTTLTSLMGEAQAAGFVQILNARIRQSSAGVAVLTPEVHSESFVAHMRSSYDLIFDLKVETELKLQRYLRISRFTEGSHPANWIPFTITSKGIVIDLRND